MTATIFLHKGTFFRLAILFSSCRLFFKSVPYSKSTVRAEIYKLSFCLCIWINFVVITLDPYIGFDDAEHPYAVSSTFSNDTLSMKVMNPDVNNATAQPSTWWTVCFYLLYVSHFFCVPVVLFASKVIHFAVADFYPLLFYGCN